MTRKPLRLVEAAKSVKPGRKGPASWIDRLSDAERKEVIAAKAQWKAGTPPVSARAFAKWLVNYCRECGVQTCEPEHMRQWLSKD